MNSRILHTSNLPQRHDYISIMEQLITLCTIFLMPD